MRANVYDWNDQEVMVSKYSEKLALLYKAQVELYKLIVEDAETSKIEAAVSRVAMLSFELTEMPDIPETVKEWHERVMEKAFPENAISGSPNSTARGAAPPADGSGVPGRLVTLRGAARGLTAGAVAGRGPVTGVISGRQSPARRTMSRSGPRASPWRPNASPASWVRRSSMTRAAATSTSPGSPAADRPCSAG
jgi:hypothetical protein